MKTVLKNMACILWVATLLIGCQPNTKQTEEAPVEKKDVYIQLYSVRDDIGKDFYQTIKDVAAIGYTGVEAAGYSEGKFYNLSPSEFTKAIEETGMKVLSSHTGKPLAEKVAETNWQETWTWWDECIKAHKEAGIKYLVMPWMPTPKTIADLNVYCNYLNQIGEKCNEAGIRFGYHNHSFEFKKVEDELMYDYLLANTDLSKVFFQMDVYWTVRGGHSPVEYFKANPSRFELLHFKDHKELGESGMVGFDAILNNINLAGTKYIIVEVEKYNHTPLESVKISYDYVQSIL